MKHGFVCLTLATLIAGMLTVRCEGAEHTSPQARERLQAAREMLTGANKNLAAAKQHLLQMFKDHATELTPYDECISYIYLGYIEDHFGNRSAAIRWFTKGVQVKGDSIDGTRSVAERGVKQSLTWLKHLDAGQTNRPAQRRTTPNNNNSSKKNKKSSWDFQVARRLLTGSNKTPDMAEKVLYKLIKTSKDELSAYELCMSYIYLGYIEDLRGHRDKAIHWFTLATEFKGDSIEGTRSVAEYGLTKPLTWLKHLDEGQTTGSAQSGTTPNDSSLSKETGDTYESSWEYEFARELLTGSDKEPDEAEKILIKLIKTSKDTLSAYELSMSYIYLGYIEDLRGHREKAIHWFTLATEVEGGNRAVAEYGLTKPLTWLKHLDAESRPDGNISQDKNILQKIDNAVVYRDPPTDLTPPQENLTRQQMSENFETLAKAIDRYYSFFIHKGIEWDRICFEYRQKLQQVQNTEQFYEMMYHFVRELGDAHSWLHNYQSSTVLSYYSPAISIRQIEGKPVVVDVLENSAAYQEGVRPGWIIDSVDGQPFEKYLDGFHDRLSMSSSERNFREKAMRCILCGDEDTRIQLDFLALNRKAVPTIVLERNRRMRQMEPKPTFSLVEFEKVCFGRHRSGYGYIRIKTFTGRMEIADEFDKALEVLQHTKGLIIDIRDNPGGSGVSQNRIIGRFLVERAAGSVSYRRNGPKHDDFSERPEYIGPAGEWQYEKPVGLLMNPITGSASDLFAARFISTGRVKTMGRTTHGNVTGVGVYAVLPCNLIVRISTGYITDANGRIIEGNGNEPEIVIEPTIDHARRGFDGVLERAFLEMGKVG